METSDESGIIMKPLVTEDYNKNMGYVDNNDQISNSYGISRRIWKWTKKLFFHLRDAVIVNALIIHRNKVP
jgi:hypothetical protein